MSLYNRSVGRRIGSAAMLATATDSRSDLLGVIDERYVVGKAIFLLFPGRTAQYLGELPGTGERDFGRIGLIA